MDEANTAIRPQASVCSDSNGDETSHDDPVPRQLCLVGSVSDDIEVRRAAELFGVTVVDTPEERTRAAPGNVYVLNSFEGELFTQLNKAKMPLLGPLAIRQLARKNEMLPNNTRPLYNLAMSGVVLCFTGFRNKEDLVPLVPLIHHMGGSIRKDMTSKVTHLIANVSGGNKYHYAITFRLPVLHPQWVFESWERRYDIDFSATIDSFVAEFKLKPFHGAKVCFVGFPECEEKHMIEVLEANGGTVSSLDDPNCTHVVMESAKFYTIEAANAPTNPQTPPSHNDTYHPLNASIHHPISPIYPNEDDFLRSSRKRKIPIDELTLTKVKCEKSFSEGKRRLSTIFRTPVDFLTHRRRTIDTTTSLVDDSFNCSVASSSGAFTVDTLDSLNENVSTPVSRPKRRCLFRRTFGSSKFSLRNRTKKKRHADDNADSIGRSLNSSCFPNIPSNVCSIPDTSLCPYDCSELRSDRLKDLRGSTVAVIDESTITEKPEAATRALIVRAEWFWTSVQKDINLEEKDYLFNDHPDQVLSPGGRRESHTATPSSASRRKRKRLQETLLSLAQHQPSPGLHKRRSSVSEAGLLSVSGSFLDCTASPDKALGVDVNEAVVDTPRKGLTPRQQVFLELVQTETNYVDILSIIMTMFKKHLEEMPEEDMLLNNTELNLIFGKIPAIYEAHVNMLNELRRDSQYLTDNQSIGNIIVKHSSQLLKAYPPFINYFEEMKEVLTQCDQNKPRFHAFLKACQTRPECGRQSLQELMIRPVQRLGSISLLLNDILKHTPKTNPDHTALEQALAALREVMTHINEDKRKAEGQVTLFNIFNDIDNCPPGLVSSHRSFVAKADVVQLSSSEGLSSKGNSLMLYLFTDQLEVCKKKSKTFSSLKSPSGVSSLPRSKSFKHVKLIPLNSIKRVIDIKETDECQRVFSLVCRTNEEMKERLYSFAMADEETDKVTFLKTLTRQMANNACTPDADKFLAYLEPHQLDIDTSEVSNGTLSKAFKFATRTKLKVGRAFSFNKTPSKLKRAVSSMMSPFGSSTNITPASQLAQMRLASYNNINELGNAENSSENPPIAPMSVQPTRKLKSASLKENALKRL